MTTFYIMENNQITQSADWRFSSSCVETQQEIIRGFDGRLYFKGQEPQKDLDFLKLEKLLEINNTYEKEAQLVKIDTPDSEVLTWDIQKSEAEAWQKNNAVITPFIDGLAASRQIERSILIQKIIEKVTAFNTYMAALTGKRQYYEDLIKKAQNKEELSSITWN